MTRGRDDRVCLGVKIDRINIIMAMINVRIVAPYIAHHFEEQLYYWRENQENQRTVELIVKSQSQQQINTHFLQILLLQPFLLKPLNTEPESYHSVACMPVIRKLKVRIS